MEILGDSREFQGLTSASRQGGRLPRARMWEPARVPKGGLTANAAAALSPPSLAGRR